MKARELIYFIQGYFEIAEAGGNSAALTVEQFKAIKKLIKDVDKKPTNNATDQACMATIKFIDGILSTDPTPANLKSTSKLIKERLNDTFLHSVDQSYDGNQTNFQNIHNGGQGIKPEVIFRC